MQYSKIYIYKKFQHNIETKRHWSTWRHIYSLYLNNHNSSQLHHILNEFIGAFLIWALCLPDVGYKVRVLGGVSWQALSMIGAAIPMYTNPSQPELIV